jgi:hypothetical protein
LLNKIYGGHAFYRFVDSSDKDGAGFQFSLCVRFISIVIQFLYSQTSVKPTS